MTDSFEALKERPFTYKGDFGFLKIIERVEGQLSRL